MKKAFSKSNKMNKHIYFLFFLIALGICSTRTYSQTLNINQFGVEEGLPQSSIQMLLQDKQGNIWAGTMGGVSRFNGLTFENFGKKEGLSETRVVSGCMDKHGNIWLGHWVGGISKYHALTRKFHEVHLPHALINNKTINCLFEDAKGNIWMGTKGSGIIVYTPSPAELNGTSTEIEKGSFSVIKKQNGLSDDNINCIQQDQKGIIWVATDNGATKIRLLQKGDKTDYSFALLQHLPATVITAILPDYLGNMWMGTNNNGLFRLNKCSEENITSYTVKDGLSSNSIKVLFEDKKHTLFIGTYGGGVSKYLRTLEANHYKGPVFQTIGTSQGLSNDKVLSITQDREQNIWIGTYLNLNQYYDEQFEIYGEAEGLVNSLIWSVIQSRNGDFWLGTEGGLIKYNPNQNPNQNSFTKYSSTALNKDANTTALFEDREGNIWFSNFTDGVSSMNPTTRKVTHYNDIIKSAEIFTIAGDKSGNIWIGTNHDGVFKIEAGTHKISHFKKEDGLGSNEVYTIFNDSKNNLWFGTLGGYLTLFDGKQFKTFTRSEGYDNKFTVCITEDSNGNIWMGSYNGGIYRYDGKKFKSYADRKGASESPFLLVCDAKNNLWIGTSKGLDKFNILEETFKHYGKKDGFLGIEINPNAVCKDKEGNLWFGSIIGLVKYNLKQEKKNLIAPIITLKKPRVFFMDTQIPENHILPYDKNYLTFDFVGASLTNPQRVKYQYILEGLDQHWSPVTKENNTTYPNLQPGRYVFKLKAANNDDVWNVEPVTFSFEISPPFYRTWWFYTLCGLTLIFLTYLFIKKRELKFIETTKILESKVAQRTAELTAEKENVTRQYAEINLQKTELENKNSDITDSIDSAKSIQEALILRPDQLQKVFPDAFILYKPKDIVSGDFYWINTMENKILLAAVDCTGHGVPGAFMSLLGYNLIEGIVKEHKYSEPATILNKLSLEVASALKHNTGGMQVKSGMDMALLSIDLIKKEMQFAGAHNPVYCIRNNELLETKGNKLSIGGSIFKSAETAFTNHTIPLQKDDVIYIFSDGYADQIGGPERKKFFYKPFKDLLISLHKLPFESQKQQLEKTIREWRGTGDQTDDILIIGFKVF
jgi:ligand-binding sensor domain-containing protein/serine phosphatase RsbU (regulator of sigma subunit)